MKNLEKMLLEFSYYLKEHNKSDKTVKDYCYNMSLFAKYVEDSRGEEFQLPILVSQCNDYLCYLVNIEKKSAVTANVRMAAIQSFSDFCNVAYGVPKIKVPRKKAVQAHQVEVLTPHELSRLKDTVERSGNKLHIAIFYLLRYSGIRETELINLDLDDITITDRKQYVTIRSGKGDKWRQVKLHVKARQPLLEYLAIRGQNPGRLFVSYHGPLTANAVYKMIRRYGVKAGIDKAVYPHMLRHQCFTEQAKHCVTAQDLKNLSSNAGHSSVELTMHYYVANDRDGMDGLIDAME